MNMYVCKFILNIYVRDVVSIALDQLLYSEGALYIYSNTYVCIHRYICMNKS